MLQGAAIGLFIAGIISLIMPTKMVENRNKKNIQKGQAAMTPEEIRKEIKKARFSGLALAAGGFVLFSLTLILF